MAGERTSVARGPVKTSKSTVRSRMDANYESLAYGIAKSTLGNILVATSDKGVVAVFIGGSATAVVNDLRTYFSKAHLVRNDQMHADELSQLIKYIESAQEDVSFNLDMRGTDFQKKVWQAVRRLKVGETTTYTDLARTIGSPKAIRAVANACSSNPFAFAVPCHRVLHKERALSFSPNRGNDRQRPMVDREANAVKL